METIVAIGIMTVAISGIMNLVYQGSVASRFQTDQITATYLAADAIEYVRADRDTYWLEKPRTHRFDEWVNAAPITECTSACAIDTRIGEESITECNDGCDPLDYNDSTKLYGYGNGSESRFTRTVEINAIDNGGPTGDDEAEITVTVSWQHTLGSTAEITIQQSIFDYRDSN